MGTGCATAPVPTPRGVGANTVPVAKDPDDRCIHGVPCETCVRCHPALAAQFKAAGDWCVEHGVPESQCGLCHPDVIVRPPVPPDGADLQHLVRAGEDLASLDAYAVRGKVTIFDFYADSCGPCRKVDEHVFALLRVRSDVAYRKLNVGSWDTPLAKRHLTRVSGLPYVVVYGKDGRPAGAMIGLHLDELDRAISTGSTR